ncbi:MAG TPA: hypothetical protein VNH83_31375 [Bryobacteraceae bacterium]|nr:hypothetical protein [Bryobacteraceae bacterium]
MAKQAGTDQDLLAMALVGYEAQRAKIDAAIRDIQDQLGHRGPGRPRVETGGAAPAKRTLSIAARKRIAAAQRKRWAAVRKAAQPAKPRRKLSAAARKGMGDATRKRWPAMRKAAAQTAKPMVKPAAPKVATAAS